MSTVHGGVKLSHLNQILLSLNPNEGLSLSDFKSRLPNIPPYELQVTLYFGRNIGLLRASRKGKNKKYKLSEYGLSYYLLFSEEREDDSRGQNAFFTSYLYYKDPLFRIIFNKILDPDKSCRRKVLESAFEEHLKMLQNEGKVEEVERLQRMREEARDLPSKEFINSPFYHHLRHHIDPYREFFYELDILEEDPKRKRKWVVTLSKEVRKKLPIIKEIIQSKQPIKDSSIALAAHIYYKPKQIAPNSYIGERFLEGCRKLEELKKKEILYDALIMYTALKSLIDYTHLLVHPSELEKYIELVFQDKITLSRRRNDVVLSIK